MAMFHSNTERLIDYWRDRGGEGQLPLRSQIDPADFAELWPQAFMLGRAASGDYRVRLAGAFVSELHRKDLRGRNALELFRYADRRDLQTALEAARLRPEPLVATVEAVGDTATVPVEILFAPLGADSPGAPDRYLGLYQPLGIVSRLMGEAVHELAVRGLRGAGPANEEAPRLRLAAVDGRRIA